MSNFALGLFVGVLASILIALGVDSNYDELRKKLDRFEEICAKMNSEPATFTSAGSLKCKNGASISYDKE